MCRSCELDAGLDSLPRYERLFVDDLWRVSHGWSSLPGWCVVSLRRHAIGLHELTEAEFERLGRLQYELSAGLHELVGAERTYLMLFAEHPDFHLHFHVVPRMAWFGEDDLAVNVFRFLNVPEHEQVPRDERDRLARALGGKLRAAFPA